MKTGIKRLFTILLSLLGAVIVVVLIYVAYVFLQYYRIPDHQELVTDNPQTSIIESGMEYKVTTYNIGFGAYSDDYTFFMDSAVDKDGTKHSGHYGKGRSEEETMKNTVGAATVLSNQNSDFYLIQEVDTDSTRSYHINQKEYLSSVFSNMSSTFAVNYHSAWLNLPLYDPIGISNSGLLLLSKYNSSFSERRSYPISNSFTKVTDLDRCFLVQRIPVSNGKTLVLVNSHMSAYDKGGKIREQQLKMLNDFLSEEYKKGNYVIVGGDFNHALGSEYATSFESNQQVPSWVNMLDDDMLSPHFSIVKPINGNEVSSCRSPDLPYEKGKSYVTIVDGFIISDNIKAESKVIETEYKFSDHQPVTMTFTLL